MATHRAEEYYTDNAIRKMGIKALTEALGPVGMARFIRQFDQGEGDYTKDRAAWLDGITMDEIMRELAERRKEQP